MLEGREVQTCAYVCLFSPLSRLQLPHLQVSTARRFEFLNTKNYEQIIGYADCGGQRPPIYMCLWHPIPLTLPYPLEGESIRFSISNVVPAQAL